MKQTSLFATYFFLGAFALISQTMILREFFVVVYGNEFIFGVLLTNWLLGIFAGAMAGGFIAKKIKNNLKIFIASLLIMSVLFPIAITAIRLLYLISGTAPGTYVGFTNVFIYSAIFIIPISFFVGFSFPIAARVHVENESPINFQVSKIAGIYIFEAVGSLFSGIVYTFLLVGNVNPYTIVFASVLPLPVACLFLLKRGQTNGLRIASALLITIYIVALTPYVNNRIENDTVAKRWSSFSQLPLTYSTDSKYQNIVVARLWDRYNLYLNTMFAGVFPDDEDNKLLAAHLMVQHPAPRRILVIGDAVSGPARHLLQYDIEKIISIEIDKKVVNTIFKYLPSADKAILEQDNRFEIKIMDGRKYVKEHVNGIGMGKSFPFDMVYLNIPEPSTLLLNRYYTEEFFHDISRIVGKNGVLAFKITASENYNQGVVSDYTASIYNTVKSIFPHVVAAPGMHSFIFASKDAASISCDPDVLMKRYQKTGAEPQRLGLIFQSLYPRGKTDSLKNALIQNNRYKINTDETPVAGFYYNKIIGWYGKSRVSRVLEFFEKVRLMDVSLIVLIFFLFRLLFSLTRRSPAQTERQLKFHVLLVVFSCGMAGLALELVILYTFQNNFGEVYHLIGLIIAVFMFGLPLGAYVSKRFAVGKSNRSAYGLIWFLIFIQVAIAMFSFLLPLVVGGVSGGSLGDQAILFMGMILVGFAVGLVFPVSVSLYLGMGENAGRVAGIVNAFDHIGAAIGAFFIGSLFLPVMGVTKVCRLIALFPLMSSLLLLTDILKQKYIKIRK